MTLPESTIRPSHQFCYPIDHEPATGRARGPHPGGSGGIPVGVRGPMPDHPALVAVLHRRRSDLRPRRTPGRSLHHRAVQLWVGRCSPADLLAGSLTWTTLFRGQVGHSFVARAGRCPASKRRVECRPAADPPGTQALERTCVLSVDAPKVSTGDTATRCRVDAIRFERQPGHVTA